MTPSEMQIQIIKDQASERLRDAAARRRDVGPAASPGRDASVCIRLAGEGDDFAMRRLGELEGGALPDGEALVAVVDGRVLAAIGMKSGETLADPFQHTAGLVGQLIGARAQTLGLASGRGLRALWRRLGGGRRTPRAAGTPAVPGSETLLIR